MKISILLLTGICIAQGRENKLKKRPIFPPPSHKNDLIIQETYLRERLDTLPPPQHPFSPLLMSGRGPSSIGTPTLPFTNSGNHLLPEPEHPFSSSLISERSNGNEFLRPLPQLPHQSDFQRLLTPTKKQGPPNTVRSGKQFDRVMPIFREIAPVRNEFDRIPSVPSGRSQDRNQFNKPEMKNGNDISSRHPTPPPRYIPTAFNFNERRLETYYPPVRPVFMDPSFISTHRGGHSDTSFQPLPLGPEQHHARIKEPRPSQDKNWLSSIPPSLVAGRRPQIPDKFSPLNSRFQSNDGARRPLLPLPGEM